MNLYELKELNNCDECPNNKNTHKGHVCNRPDFYSIGEAKKYYSEYGYYLPQCVLNIIAESFNPFIPHGYTMNSESDYDND